MGLKWTAARGTKSGGSTFCTRSFWSLWLPGRSVSDWRWFVRVRNNPNPRRSFAGRVAIVFSQRHGLTRARGGDRAVEAGSAARRTVLAAAKVPDKVGDTPTPCPVCPPDKEGEWRRWRGGSLGLRKHLKKVAERPCTRSKTRKKPCTDTLYHAIPQESVRFGALSWRRSQRALCSPPSTSTPRPC